MADVLDLPQLVTGLPPAPPPGLWPALDAAHRCFARHGLTRTSMTDIGREARVSRSTIYRQLGSIERAARLLAAREVHELVAHLGRTLAKAEGPDTIIAVVAEVVLHARTHPVLQKVLADEPELIGPYLLSELPAATDQIAAMVAPVLRAAMRARLIRRQDAGVLAHWLVRIATVLVIDPPPMPIERFLHDLLAPVLTIDRS